MSLWYFLSGWFAGVPTRGALFKRSMFNGAWAFVIIIGMALFQVPAKYAAVVFFSVFLGNGVMFFVFQRQREQPRD